MARATGGAGPRYEVYFLVGPGNYAERMDWFDTEEDACRYKGRLVSSGQYESHELEVRQMARAGEEQP